MVDPVRAAMGYAAAGWPVLPAWPLSPDGACTCPAGATCPEPGTHPAAEPAEGAGGPAEVWRARRWNILLRTGGELAVIEAGTALGAQAMRILERGRPPYPAGSHIA